MAERTGTLTLHKASECLRRQLTGPPVFHMLQGSTGHWHLVQKLQPMCSQEPGNQLQVPGSSHSRRWQEHQVPSLGLCFHGQEQTRHCVPHHVPTQPAGSQAGHLCPSGSLAASAPWQEPTNSKRHHLSITRKRLQLPASFPACPSFPTTCLSFSSPLTITAYLHFFLH